eukprot:373366-Prymnesium_polylepis.1
MLADCAARWGLARWREASEDAIEGGLLVEVAVAWSLRQAVKGGVRAWAAWRESRMRERRRFPEALVRFGPPVA